MTASFGGGINESQQRFGHLDELKSSLFYLKTLFLAGFD